GQAASVQIGTEVARPLQYLVRTGARTFELREFAGAPALGISIQMTAQAGDAAGQIEISPLKVTMTTMDGRERVPGLELEVGKPIISTRSLETTMTVIDGSEVNGIAMPGPAGRQPVLFLSARRVKETPGETLPNPLPGLFSPVAGRAAPPDQSAPKR